MKALASARDTNGRCTTISLHKANSHEMTTESAVGHLSCVKMVRDSAPLFSAECMVGMVNECDEACLSGAVPAQSSAFNHLLVGLYPHVDLSTSSLSISYKKIYHYCHNCILRQLHFWILQLY